VGALIVDSSGDGTFNHVMLVTKTFSATREFGDNWIPVELIYPEFELGQSVPISRVYPLMADAQSIRSPVTRKTISGLGSAEISRTLKPRVRTKTNFGEMLAKHPLARLFRGK